MDPKLRRALEADGWRVGTVQGLLELTDVDAELLDIYLRLVDEIKRRLVAQRISQATLAKKLRTSASRLSNMLAGRDLSADGLVRALLVLGATSTAVGARRRRWQQEAPATGRIGRGDEHRVQRTTP